MDRGKYPGAPLHHIRKKRKTSRPQKVPDRPSGERGKGIKKKTRRRIEDAMKENRDDRILLGKIGIGK
jgi:hypothetical protein